MAVELRPGRLEDADILAAIVHEGFASYSSFAPPGWTPPDEIALASEQRKGLARDCVWCLVAEDEPAGVAGHAAFVPSTDSNWPLKEPELAHLWQLFVRPPWWGTGVGAQLLERVHEAARERGFARIRLYTPAGQARARRFYERAGWEPHGLEFDSGPLGLPLIEYRREL